MHRREQARHRDTLIYVRLDGWTSGSVPLQPEARTRTLVGGVTTLTPPLKRGRRSE